MFEGSDFCVCLKKKGNSKGRSRRRRIRRIHGMGEGYMLVFASV